MATKQRLRAVLDARRASRPCWRCALNLPRCNSTSAAGMPDSSKSTGGVPYGPALQQECEDLSKPVLPGQKHLHQRPLVRKNSATLSFRKLSSDRPRIRSVGTTNTSFRKFASKRRKTASDVISKKFLFDVPHIRSVSASLSFRKHSSNMRKTSSDVVSKKVLFDLPHIRLVGRPISSFRKCSSNMRKTASDAVSKKVLLDLPHIRSVSALLSFRKHMSSMRKTSSDVVSKKVLSDVPYIRSVGTTSSFRKYSKNRRKTASDVVSKKVLSDVPHIRSVSAPLSFRKHSSNIRKTSSDVVSKKVLFDLPHIRSVGTKAASGVLDGSRSKWSQNVRKPRIRVMINEQSVAPSSPSQSRSRKTFQKSARSWKTIQKSARSRKTIQKSARSRKAFQKSARVKALGLVPRKVLSKTESKSARVIRKTTTSLGYTTTRAPLETDVGKKLPADNRQGDIVGTKAMASVVRKFCAKESKREDEDFQDAVTSLLDEFRDSDASNLPNSTREIGGSISNIRFSPRDRVTRRVALSENLTPNPRRLFSTRTPRAKNKYYATATSPILQAEAPIESSNTGTKPDGLLKVQSRGIREALRLWQEQHGIALADTSGRPPSSTLSDTQNLFTQSGEDESFAAVARDDEVEDDDDVDFGSDEPTPDIFAHRVFLRRGDLVELVAASEPLLAIFVRNVADQCQFYTIRGEWVHREPGGARWAVSRFVNPDDLNDILPYLPAEGVAEEKMDRLHPVDLHAPRGAGAKVLEQMLLFHQSADAVFRKHADRINRLYEIIAPSGTFADRTYMSLKDIAMKVLMKQDPSELTQPMMWAIHRAITQCQNIVWDQMNYRQNPIYEIYPQQGLKYISQVREWVREYQEGIIQDTTNESMFDIDSAVMAATRSLNPVATFVKKARLAIKRSRRTRPLSESGFVGPSSVRINIDKMILGMPYKEFQMEDFDENERIIIHYLDVWATSSYVNAYTNLASLGPMILRAVGMYEGFELDESRGYTLLQELGVIKPWENRTVYYHRNLRLPRRYGGSGEASRLLAKSLMETKLFEPKDSMEGLRKDWGDMPVFCIDSAETLERDDGVSLELVDNEPSAFWVHVHVANPSAFIAPDSDTAKHAASLGESIYFPERKYPMLSPKLTNYHFSLANDRPCITFSAKISADGDLLEKKVTPGIVRNVHYLTPRMVGHGLGLTEADEELETVSILTVGGRMPTQPIGELNQTAKALTDPGHIKALHKLLDLGEAARHKRAKAGAPDFYSSARIANTYPVVYLSGFKPKNFKFNDKNVRRYEGDPIIALQRTTEFYGLVAKMVSDLMIIAGDVGASWCSERNIPIPYRGILRNPEPASPPEAFKRDVVDPKIAKYGRAEQSDLLRYMRLVGQAQTSHRPLEHHTLGLPAYCKATSPLRRYIDMYAHWQIEAAIRHEASTGTSLVGSTDDSYLPFSRAQVEEHAGGAIHRERTIKLAKTASARHWICQALFRAFHFKEAALPETFEVTTIEGSARRGYYPGWLKTWNVKVQLRFSPAVLKEAGWRVGDVWETRLRAVDSYHKNIDMEPVRLVERERERERVLVV